MCARAHVRAVQSSVHTVCADWGPSIKARRFIREVCFDSLQARGFYCLGMYKRMGVIDAGRAGQERRQCPVQVAGPIQVTPKAF